MAGEGVLVNVHADRVRSLNSVGPYHYAVGLAGHCRQLQPTPTQPFSAHDNTSWRLVGCLERRSLVQRDATTAAI